jgi:PAS domain-containing protein
MEEARGSNPLSSTIFARLGPLKSFGFRADNTSVSGRLRKSAFPHHAEAVHAVLSTSTQAGLELNTDLTIRSADPCVTSLLGVEPHDLLQRPITDLVVAEDRPLVASFLHQSDPSQTSLEVRAQARPDRRPAALELSAQWDHSGIRVNLQDVLSWRVTELALRGLAQLNHPLVAFTAVPIARLDQQCRAIELNSAWVDATGITAPQDGGLRWLRALDQTTIEAFRTALPALCNGEPFAADGYLRHTNGTVRSVKLGIAPVVDTDRQFGGLVLVAVVRAVLAESAVAAGGLRFPTRPVSEATPTIPPTSAAPARTVRISAEPDPAVSLALASVLSAARARFVAPEGFATDLEDLTPDPASDPASDASTKQTVHQEGIRIDLGVPAVPTNALPKLRAYDEVVRRRAEDVQATAASGLAGPGVASSGLAGSGLAGSGLAGSGLDRMERLIESTGPNRAFVDPADRIKLLDHLQRFHEQAPERAAGHSPNTHSVAIVFLDVLEAATTSPGARSALMGLLEHRLRSAVRRHEYASPIGDRGFVVAARGSFDKKELKILVDRLVQRLDVPMRASDGLPQFAVCTGAVRSFPGEADAELILRAELARARALAAGPGTALIS